MVLLPHMKDQTGTAGAYGLVFEAKWLGVILIAAVFIDGFRAQIL